MRHYQTFTIAALLACLIPAMCGATALTDDRALSIRQSDTQIHRVEAAEVIYQGALVANEANGYIEAAASTSAGPVLGVALTKADNSTGAAGAKSVQVRSNCTVLLVGSGLAESDVGDIAYCSDDQTITLTPNSVPVGVVTDVVSATSAWVYIPQEPILYDSSGGLLTDPRISGAIMDSNGNEEIALTATTSAVNHIGLTNAATGNAPDLKFTGDNTVVNGTITTKGAGDITITAGDDAALRSGTASSDLVTLSGYDVDGAAYDSNIVVTSSNTPDVTIQADGGIYLNGTLTLSDGAGTGNASIGAAAGSDITVSTKDDLTLNSGTAIGDIIALQTQDVDGAARDTNILLTSGNTPTVAIQADGGIALNGALTLSDAAGTGAAAVGVVAGQDIEITSGDDAALRSGTASSDLVTLSGYDVDGAAYKSMVLVTSGNTPSVMLGTAAADLVGFYGVGPVARPAAFTQTYATADKTHANATQATLVVGTLGGTADGTMETVGATNGGDVSGAIMNNDQELFAQVNAAAADVLDVKQALNALIDDLQSQGLIQ